MVKGLDIVLCIESLDSDFTINNPAASSGVCGSVRNGLYAGSKT